jgi:hypothetical protein
MGPGLTSAAKAGFVRQLGAGLKACSTLLPSVAYPLSNRFATQAHKTTMSIVGKNRCGVTMLLERRTSLRARRQRLPDDESEELIDG